MRILYLGSPSYAVKPLEALVQAGYTIVGVVTQPDRPAGRRNVLTPPPVKQAAQQFNIPVIQHETLRCAEVVEQLSALQPDIGIVAAFGEILRKNVLDIPPLGYINVHPSLLPLYRGPAPVVGAILAGDTETGVTIMKLEETMDSGPILGQVTIPLHSTARTGLLTDELFALGSELLLRVLEPYAAGRLDVRPQDHRQATYTRLIKKADGCINWTQPALVIERHIRAYDPWPSAFTMWHGQQIKIHAANVHAQWQGDALPGHIVGIAEGPLVATGSGALEIIALQPSGKRLMTSREWLAGHHDVIGQEFRVCDTIG